MNLRCPPARFLMMAILSASAVVWLGFPGQAAFAAPGTGVLYGTDAAGGNLLAINTATGVGTVIGPMLTSNMDSHNFPSLAVNPVTGRMYAGEGHGTGLFYEVDPSTGAVTLVGSTGLGYATVSGLDFNANGVLYAAVNIAGAGGTGADHLATIDVNTGVATIIGPFGACTGVTIPTTGSGSCTIEGIEGIAFDASGTLWAAHNARSTAGQPGLYSIDTTTGAATFRAPITDGAGHQLSGGVVSLEFDCNGTLYGGSARSQPGANDGGRLVTIDPVTGIGAFVGSVPATPTTTSLGGLAYGDSCGPPPMEPRSTGFWKHQCTGQGYTQVSMSEMDDLFSQLSLTSTAFDECASANCTTLEIEGAQSQMRPKAERQALALWLNVASGRLPGNTPISLPSLTSAATVGEALAEVDATLCDGSAKKSDLETAKNIAESLNLGTIDMEVASAYPVVSLTAGQSTSLDVALLNFSDSSRDYSLHADGPWPVTLSQTQVTGLASGAQALLTATFSAPVSAASGSSEMFTITATDLQSGETVTRQIAVSGVVTAVGNGGGPISVKIKEAP